MATILPFLGLLPHFISPSLTAVILIFAILALSLYHKDHRLPPGPRPLPGIGNLLQLPRRRQYEAFRDWSNKYGPVVSFRLPGKQYIVLNDLETVLDLLERRSAIYSTRPRSTMVGELVGRDRHAMLFMRYGPLLRQSKRLCHGWINQHTAIEHRPLQEAASLRLLQGIYESPQYYAEHLRAYIGSMILKLTYGFEVTSKDDQRLLVAERLEKITGTAMEPGRWLVDSIPYLKYIPSWFPGASFQCWASEAKRICDQIVFETYQQVKTDIDSGHFVPSWTANHILTEPPRTQEELDVLLCASSSMYSGASGTAPAFIQTFILFMAMNRTIQQKAQEEIDNVVGTDRLPNHNDLHNLPYIDACIKEVFRLYPTATLVPHSLDTDDVYRGYLIPKHSWVVANVWAILRDPSVYRLPDEFRPERFLGPEPEPDRTEYVFGFGRRYCPGYHFGMGALVLSIMRILAVFDISVAEDESDPKLEFPPGIIMMPKPFKCNIKPRNKDTLDLIMQA